MANGYDNYKQQSVQTMTQGEMLILLYDELIKRLIKAGICIETKDDETFDATVTRCIEIVRYLIDTLDRSSDIGMQIYRMYDFFMFQLGRLKAGRRQALIDEMMPLVKDLRDAFKEAAKSQGD